MTLFTDPKFDLIAVIWFFVLIGGYRALAERSSLERSSIVAAVQNHRVSWMLNMSARENRILDGVLLGQLTQGNAIFASTSEIAVGGLAALLGSGEKVQAMLERLPFIGQSQAWIWETKILLMMAIFIYAFFKFAWATRLSHYTAIMIGSTPIAGESNQTECATHAHDTAELIGIAADHSNSGIRSFYYAIAALAWFVHPLAFMAATTWVIFILTRRDFFSRSLAILSRRARSPDGQP